MTGLVLPLVFMATAVTTYIILAPDSETLLVRQRALAIQRHREGRAAEKDIVEEELELPFASRVLIPMLERFNQWVLRLAPARIRQGLEIKLLQAGQPLSTGQYLAVQIIAAAGLGLLGLIISSPFLEKKAPLALVLVMAFAFLGWRLPQFWLARVITTRRHGIDRALPDVLDLLSVSVEAGLGLDGAIQKVGEKFPEPTAGEFREMLKQIRLGAPRADALRALAQRTGLADMRTFAAAVIQAEQLGVPISRVLKAQAEALRLKRKQKVEERAMALPLKMLFPLILFIFPTVFIVVLGPVVISFVTTMMHR